jgi:enterochelin esterase-like enzyme
MRTHTDLFDSQNRQNTLLVLLPPAESKIEDFFTQGFVAAVRSREIRADIVLAEVTHQHVMNKTIVSALHEHVMQPALASGYQEIWFAGISLGAFNTLYYAAEYAKYLSGIYLIAPYPGTGDILAEIAGAGGAAEWARTLSSNRKDERAWWHWIAQESAAGQWATQVYFGTGDEDRFLRGQRMLAGLLPEQNVRMISGKHSWPTWQTLWHDWLARAPLPLTVGAKN